MSRSTIVTQEQTLKELENRMNSLFDDSLEDSNQNVLKNVPIAGATPNAVQAENPTVLSAVVEERLSTVDLAGKNVTINSDLNEEYQPNETQYQTAADGDNSAENIGDTIVVKPHFGVQPTQPAKIYNVQIAQDSVRKKPYKFHEIFLENNCYIVIYSL